MTTTAFSDAELLAQARDGDEAAFTELYVRHQAAARRVATAYPRAGDPDDLVNGAFERVLGALRRGAGPTDAFRAYLFVTLRRLAADQIERIHDEPMDEVPEPVVAQQRTPIDPADRKMVVEAYESLPERWQAVLWQTAVEGRQPRELASVLGTSANAAAALAYRAREKLRQAYLQAHLQTTPRPQCEPHRSRLGAYVREGLSRKDRGATEGHVDKCDSCRTLVAELLAVNELLVRSLHPVFVASAAAEAGAGAALGGAITGGGMALAAKRLASKARSNPAVVAGGVLMAALAFALVSSLGGDGPKPGEEAAPEPKPPRSQLQTDPPAPPDAEDPPADEPATVAPRPTATTTTTAPPGAPDVVPTEAEAPVSPTPGPTPSPSPTPGPTPSPTPPPPPPEEPPLVSVYLRGILGLEISLGNGPLLDIDVGSGTESPEDCGLVAILVNVDSC